MQKQDVFLLLKQWCDALLKYQIRDAGNKIFDGALLCPACMKIHGRCHDAVYPFLYMADATKDEKYIRIAEKLFRWGDNLFCDDDSFYSDSQHAWNGTTIFSVVGYWEILNYHKEILSAQFARDIEERMRKAADWIYRTFCGKVETNINYYAAASAALSLVAAYHFEEAAGTDIRQSRESCADDGRKDREHTNWEHRGDKKAEDMLRRARYLKLAKKLADLCMSYVTEEGFLYGEGAPMDRITKRGCRAVDLGYNVEESIPSLLYYARAVKDSDMEEKVKRILYKQLDFMLPDGAWDNSFGTRNFKWTYWGSRTSDGCLSSYTFWKGREPELMEAAGRNFELLKACTGGGLLYGGPDYQVHGEQPCIHHTFCHAKDLAAVLDHWEDKCSDAQTKSENAYPEKPDGIHFYPSIGTYKVFQKKWIATITAGDFTYTPGGHASGGCLTMLYHEDIGPILCSSVTDYDLVENINMQQTLQKARHQSLTPGLELICEGERYCQSYDDSSVIATKDGPQVKTVSVVAELKNIRQERPCEQRSPESADTDELEGLGHIGSDQRIQVSVSYAFGPDDVRIHCRITGDTGHRVRYVLPVLGRTENGYRRSEDKMSYVIPGRRCAKNGVRVTFSREMEGPEAIFFLTGGFEAWKFVAAPDANGEIDIRLAKTSIEGPI